MKGIAWGMLGILVSVNLGAQPALEGNTPVVVNRVLAVVGGTRVITMQDLAEFRDTAKARQRGQVLNTADLILGELINDALLVHEVRTSKGWVMPAGLGERLLASHIRRGKKGRDAYSRGDLVKELQQDGITLEQFERQLVDKALLNAALDPIRDSVQVSPRAIIKFSELGFKESGRGPYADFLALQIPASGDGINKVKIEALVEGIKSVDDFEILAEEFNVTSGSLKGRVYFDDKYKDTHYIDQEVTTTLYGIKVGKADFHQSDEIFHVMYVTERGDQEKPNLSDSRVLEVIKGELSYRQYISRLELKLKRLKQEIDVYRPGVNTK